MEGQTSLQTDWIKEQEEKLTVRSERVVNRSVWAAHKDKLFKHSTPLCLFFPQSALMTHRRELQQHTRTNSWKRTASLLFHNQQRMRIWRLELHYSFFSTNWNPSLMRGVSELCVFLPQMRSCSWVSSVFVHRRTVSIASLPQTGPQCVERRGPGCPDRVAGFTGTGPCQILTRITCRFPGDENINDQSDVVDEKCRLCGVFI